LSSKVARFSADINLASVGYRRVAAFDALFGEQMRSGVADPGDGAGTGAAPHSRERNRCRAHPYRATALWASEDELRAMASLIPLGRMGQPEDIAALAVFLASEKSAFMTGQTMHANGGTYMQS
jgi:NAD(P)-dependent dehydrogenase (short-subunit alcohol dehydrogenase family)